MYAANDDLAHARHAFDRWRANRRGRTRIPPELWKKAVSLLDHHPISHVARELHLDPTELRKRRLTSRPPLAADGSPEHHFLEVPASSLCSETGPILTCRADPPRLRTEAALRLQIERADGHRLTLAVPLSEWPRIEALYSLFFRL